MSNKNPGEMCKKTETGGVDNSAHLPMPFRMMVGKVTRCEPAGNHSLLASLGEGGYGVPEEIKLKEHCNVKLVWYKWMLYFLLLNILAWWLALSKVDGTWALPSGYCGGKRHQGRGCRWGLQCHCLLLYCRWYSVVFCQRIIHFSWKA